MDLLMQTVNLIPDEIPFSSVLKNFTQALANEPEGTPFASIPPSV